MKRIFRKRKDSGTWHFCTNCENWPKGEEGIDYIQESASEDEHRNELCDLCTGLSSAANCYAL